VAVEHIVYSSTIETPLGAMKAVASADVENEALTGLWFIGQNHYPTSTEDWINKPDYSVFKKLEEWLASYFSGKVIANNLLLDLRGTPFQKEVWNLLLKIPFGQITTYGEIAKIIATRRGIPVMAAQAVGGAVGSNPVSIIVPCHRVLGANRQLTGYGGGLDKKKALLKIEGVEI
jgi:methylated-DNA-[protein]-cysteine S-methyltransferase